MRETGRPEVSVRFTCGTPEEAADNRENVESAFRSALLRHGENIRLKITWGEEAVRGKSEDLLCGERNAGTPAD